MNTVWRVLICGSMCLSFAHAAEPSLTQTLSLAVDGVNRTALLYVPPRDKGGALPLVFVFHGHGGTSKNALHAFGIDRLWPQAISVYPQGLATPGVLSDAEGKLPGWQRLPGDQGDRDLHFFDALLARLKKDYSVDPKRVYVTGHSNGGGFTYLLWHARGAIFAAVAPCSAAAPYAAQLTPKPAMISGGTNDPIVKFQWQQKMIDTVQDIDGCEATAAPWQTVGKQYLSKTGTPLVTYIYDGEHPMDKAEPGLIVTFFQEHAAPATQP